MGPWYSKHQNGVIIGYLILYCSFQGCWFTQRFFHLEPRDVPEGDLFNFMVAEIMSMHSIEGYDWLT